MVFCITPLFVERIEEIMYLGKIIRVLPGGLAEELGLQPGDKILEINGQRLRDIIDLSFAFADENIELLLEHESGEQELLAFDKEYDEELGAEFASAVFDGIRCCANHCWFCFVDQVAPHMRDSLYVKDDDYRLSFLYGNFVTMTNMVEADFQRIQQYHLSPLFVSVHTMDMELRAKMLRCPGAGQLRQQLDRLQAADVEYHTQVVLCPGLNDGEVLDQTICELLARRPYVQSLAIVPVGLTKYREGCYPLTMFDREGAERVVRQVQKWQREQRAETGSNFIYLSDEFYFLAGEELPAAAEYDRFPQLDNGIGLTRNFIEEWQEAAAKSEKNGYPEPLFLDVVSGTSFAPLLKKLTGDLVLPNLHVRVLPVENQFFGTSVNVSGLLTGQDIQQALQSAAGSRHGVIIPESALRAGENIFLDDISLTDLRRQLGQRVETALSGADLWQLLTHWQDCHDVTDEENVYMWQGNAAYTKPARRKNEDE